MDQGYFEIALLQPPGNILENANKVALQAEKIISQEPEVAHVLCRVNSENTNISVRLKGTGQVAALQRRLRPRLVTLDPNTKVRFSSQSASLTGSLTGAVSVRGRPILLAVMTNGSLEDLDKASQQIVQAISQVPHPVHKSHLVWIRACPLG